MRAELQNKIGILRSMHYPWSVVSSIKQVKMIRKNRKNKSFKDRLVLMSFYGKNESNLAKKLVNRILEED